MSAVPAMQRRVGISCQSSCADSWKTSSKSPDWTSSSVIFPSLSSFQTPLLKAILSWSVPVVVHVVLPVAHWQNCSRLS